MSLRVMVRRVRVCGIIQLRVFLERLQLPGILVCILMGLWRDQMITRMLVSIMRYAPGVRNGWSYFLRLRMRPGSGTSLTSLISITSWLPGHMAPMTSGVGLVHLRYYLIQSGITIIRARLPRGIGSRLNFYIQWRSFQNVQ